MNIKKISLFSLMLLTAALGTDAFAAAKTAKTSKTSKQSAIQSGTNVRTKVEVSGLYDQECYDLFYGCMDQFCISDNENGGSCACSDLNAKYEKELEEIKNTLDKAEEIKTVEVEKIKAGANADIIFGKNRRYDEDGNIIGVDDLTPEEKKKQKRESLMAMFNKATEDDDDIFDEEDDDIFSKTGGALHKAAEKLCMEQMPENCSGDVQFLRQVYGRQITSDCKGFQNSIAKKRDEADAQLASAEADVRTALAESLETFNKYDLGTCMVEFKKCMMTEDACGADWMGCVATIADANMQGIDESESFKKKNIKSSAQKAYDGSTYGIAVSTMEGLDSKRLICERVLNQCVDVRDQVWPAFLREAAPTIKLAETNAESKMRQSCLTDISDCIQKACRDDIAGKGKDTMDACLARPEMARSFCKIEIDRCERMEPQIFSYVTDKLKAMRVDVCTEEVRSCFTADTRCGENFQNCIGMDYDYIHEMCPIDSLVVCKQGNPNFSMSDLDSMLMGLYLNIDNSALDNCQKIIDEKMLEICGSTTDCNRFATDANIGTGSLHSQKDGDKYRITGLISFGSIKVGDALGSTDGGEVLRPGEIGVEDYLAWIKDNNDGVAGKDAIVSSIEAELNNIAGTINRAVQMIEQDQEIQYCINGRDLSQIKGTNEKTTARFPNLLNSVKMQIASAALHQAQENYNKKFNDEVAKATKDASADIAQYMCQKMAQQNVTTVQTPDTSLAAPYAISYEVASGLDKKDLTAGGISTSDLDGVTFSNAGYLGDDGESNTLNSGKKETRAVFNRETRVCHICTTTVTQNCKTVGSKSWFHNNRNVECETAAPVETCEDIPM